MSEQVTSFHRDVDVFASPGQVIKQEKGDRCIVEFYAKLKDSKRPGGQGHMQEYVKILFPGDNKTEAHFEVTDTYRQRWPRQYAQFKGSEAQTVEGFPLANVAWLSRSWVDTLKHAFHITTLEQLVGCDDAAIQRIGMGGRELVNKAKAHMESLSGGDAMNRLASENETLKSRLDALEKQLGEQKTSEKRGPGRPKKEEAA